jgi:hypothetical protein
MILDIGEAKKYYKIFWALLGYVNNKFSISQEFDEQVENERVLPLTTDPIREKLWSDDSLLGSFVSENPAELTDDELDIAASWKHRIKGTFFVYRYLVKHTIFIDDSSPPRAYGVHGIISPLEEIITAPLPVMVKAVLLPFKDRIIIDGIMNTYNIRFGAGYRSNLDFAYRTAKERNGIITSLVPHDTELDPDQLQKSFLERNDLILKAFRKHLSRSGLSEKMVQQHTSNIERFSNDYLMDLEDPMLLLDFEDVHIEEYLDDVLSDPKAKKSNVVSLKRFIRFLNETGRLDPDDYWDTYDLLKSYQE